MVLAFSFFILSFSLAHTEFFIKYSVRQDFKFALLVSTKQTTKINFANHYKDLPSFALILVSLKFGKDSVT